MKQPIVWDDSCPMYKALELFGRKRTIFVILMLGENKISFNQILKSIAGLNSKVLSQRLKELEDQRFIVRKIVSERPIKIEYHLTEKGKEFDLILRKMGKFIHEYEESE